MEPTVKIRIIGKEFEFETTNLELAFKFLDFTHATKETIKDLSEGFYEMVIDNQSISKQWHRESFDFKLARLIF